VIDKPISQASELTADVMPLAGIKVLELGSLIAGPYASALLAQFGAEVIEVEPPKVDPFRRHWLLNGLDDIDLTLEREADIRRYEDARRALEPWIFDAI
jgi:crotonobetainyl-CoA:carnitine CoA-transferase CaiB-like acyl-CoA transferase